MKFPLLLLFLLPLCCFSQKVKINVYDKFIKKQRIELEPLLIYSSEKGKVSLTFNSLASTLFLQLSGSGWGASTIDVDNELILLFENDSTVIVRSTGLQAYEPGVSKNTYTHQYFINSEEVAILSRNKLVGIRKYLFKDFIDITITNDNAEKIRRLSSLFLSELKKVNVLKTLRRINLKDIGNYVGDSVMFYTKVYNTRYFESSENKPTLLDVQSDFSAKFVNTVILEQDRKNFNDLPEKLYLNKEVCISGIVELRNGVPYVAVHSRDQIRLLTPIAATEAALFIGDSVTVVGRIFTGKTFEDSQTLPTLLNMGAAYPDQPLTIVIDRKDRKNFIDNPEVFYLNKEVSITGKVVLYRNKPQIFLRNAEQIKITNDTPLLLAKTEIKNQEPLSVLQKTAPENFKEVMAEFPGGSDSLVSFLRTNLKCPEGINVNERRTVMTSFIIKSDGALGNIRITKSAGKDCDKEVIRVLKKMPAWRPKSINGYAMSQTFGLPITFNTIEPDK